MTQGTLRFPRIIRLHDGLDAMEDPNRRTLILLWWGLGALLIFAIAPHLMIRDFEAALAAGRPDAAEMSTRTLVAFAAGLVLLGTWLATRVYWLKKAVLPRKRQGLGMEYNPIKFDRMLAALREIETRRADPPWDPGRKRLNAEVEAYERWLSRKDADSYRAWRDRRAQEGV